MAEPKKVFELAGREVAVSNPSKVFFPKAGVTKLDMVRYYLAVAPGALAGGLIGRAIGALTGNPHAAASSIEVDSWVGHTPTSAAR